MKKIVKNTDKVKDEVSIITEAIYLGDGNYKYVVTSNENLRLGLCNISN